MTRRALVIGMLVYRDLTSKDTMISSGSMVCCRMNCEKSAYSLEFLVLISGISHLESGCYDGSEVRSGGDSCILRISVLFFQGFCICGRWFHHTVVV